MAEKTLKLMDKVGSSLLGTKTVGEKPSVFKTKSLAMMLDRQVPSKIGGKKLSDGEGDGGVALPSSDTLFGDQAGSLPSVDSQVRAYTQGAPASSHYHEGARGNPPSVVFRGLVKLKGFIY